MMAAPVSVIIGAPVSEALLKMDGIAGLAGWQWLFLIEGLPAVVLGLMALTVLTDRPEKAGWLPAPDREWLSRTMAAERASRASAGHTGIFRSLSSGRVWLLCAVYLMNTSVTYGIFLWLPQILVEASGKDGFALSLLTAIPFVAALIAMVLVGRHSDRTGERKLHVAGCALTAATGLVLAVTFQDNVPLLVLSFTLSQMGQRSIMSVFWAIPPMLLSGAGAAAGIALINSIGNMGGFFGPSMMGTLRDWTGGYTGGLLVLAGALVIEAILVMTLRLPAAAPARASETRASSPLPKLP
jgi:ACS family tartrate transporter-like MFS transporter